jgi:hypothetical protein
MMAMLCGAGGVLYCTCVTESSRPGTALFYTISWPSSAPRRWWVLGVGGDLDWLAIPSRPPRQFSRELRQSVSRGMMPFIRTPMLQSKEIG